MDDKSLPENNINSEFWLAISTQPMTAKGEKAIMIFLRPNHPDSKPPMGAKTIHENISKEANHDAWILFSFNSGRAIAAYPIRIPTDALTKLAVKAPIICRKSTLENHEKMDWKTYFFTCTSSYRHVSKLDLLGSFRFFRECTELLNWSTTMPYAS